MTHSKKRTYVFDVTADVQVGGFIEIEQDDRFPEGGDTNAIVNWAFDKLRRGEDCTEYFDGLTVLEVYIMNREQLELHTVID